MVPGGKIKGSWRCGHGSAARLQVPGTLVTATIQQVAAVMSQVSAQAAMLTQEMIGQCDRARACDPHEGSDMSLAIVMHLHGSMTQI